MFEGSTIERSARNLMKLQKKILGSENSSVYKRKKLKKFNKKLEFYLAGKYKQK